METHIIERTPQQSKVLHAIMSAMRMPEDVKRDLILQFTKERTDRSSKMSMEECRALINHLNMMQQKAAVQATVSARVADPGDKMRKKILSICHDMRMQKEGSTKIDMARVNKLCCERGYLHKELDKYTRAELPKLITQFERMLSSFLKGGQP